MHTYAYIHTYRQLNSQNKHANTKAVEAAAKDCTQSVLLQPPSSQTNGSKTDNTENAAKKKPPHSLETNDSKEENSENAAKKKIKLKKKKHGAMDADIDIDALEHDADDAMNAMLRESISVSAYVCMYV